MGDDDTAVASSVPSHLTSSCFCFLRFKGTPVSADFVSICKVVHSVSVVMHALSYQGLYILHFSGVLTHAYLNSLQYKESLIFHGRCAAE
jgi:hypothetical protein